MEKELEEKSLEQLLQWSKTMKLRARTKAEVTRMEKRHIWEIH